MKIPCNIVQDLLPSYIDELCSEETRKQMGEHLGNCQMCDKKYKEMKGELPEEFKTETEEFSVEELLPMKKIRRKHVWQLASLAVVVVAAIIAGGISTVKGSSAGYNKGYTEGTDEGYNTGYSAGTDEGYNTGYTVGADEGYNTGYTQGYVDATAENPNLLTFRVDTRNVGEMFSQLWSMMQEKWGLDDSVRIVLEEERYSFLLLDMYLCLSDGMSLYVVESYRGFGDNFYTMEVKRMAADALEIEEEAFRFEALVTCMEAFGFELKEAINERDFLFMFDNELMKDQARIRVHSNEQQSGWVYENGKVRECVEETILEGHGAYYLLNIGTVEATPLNVSEFTQVYIEMK